MIHSVKHLPRVISIGVQTETGVEPVGFDLRAWLDVWEDIKVTVWPTRPGEDAAYPAANTELVGTVLYWYPNEADTAIPGTGKVELLGLTKDKRKLSGWCETNVQPTSLAMTQETPEAARPWVDEVLEAAKNITESIVNVPYISDHGTWMMWDAAVGEYVDSGISAKGKDGKDGYIPIKGEDYADGKDGEDGISPVVDLTETADGVDISVVDVEGVKTATVHHGKNGRDGIDGQDGDTRVYVGSDEPPEDAEVWIDPEGAVSGSDLPASTETERGAVILDASLTKSGAAADAKTVGDKFTALTEEIAKLPQGGGLPELSEPRDNMQLVTDWQGNIKWEKKTHYTYPSVANTWDGDSTGKVVFPLDAFGNPGHELVHVAVVYYDADMINGAVLRCNTGETKRINAETLITDYPGALIEPDLYMAVVIDAELFAAAIGAQLPQGLYFLRNPDTGFYVESLVGEMRYRKIGRDYLPALEIVYPTAATKSFFFHMFSGEVPEEAFSGDPSITQVKSSVLVTIGKRAFMECPNITKVDLPEATDIAANAFVECSSLVIVDLSAVERISDSFGACYNLKTFLIRNARNVPTYVHEHDGTDTVSIFENTPIASGAGYIYVPRTLVNSYKAAYGWSTYANQFRALEDYTVDGTITGELDESKI